MNFAKKQLEKYGWAEGKGLGKNEDGISSPLKPKLKFDNSGIGHEIGEQFTNNWWENLFNSAAQNIDIQIDDKDEVIMKTKSKDAVEITTKSYSVKQLKKNKHLEYGSFIKTAKLTDKGTEHYEPTQEVTEPLKVFKSLTDEELLAACGGRTAHKGARHGLKLTGKLSRLEKQEKMLLRKMKKVSLSDEKEKNSAERKLKKLKKQKEENREKYTPIMEDSMESTSSSKKKSNKKRKSVSFNETVTKIYTVDLDTSFDSEIGSIRDENSNEPMLENSPNGSDEGIEQDIENNNDFQDNHRSFEEAQFNINDLSKAERKKLKKKRKLEAKKNTSTSVFLQKLDLGDEVVCDSDKDVNLKKRKFLDDCEQSNFGNSKTESPDRYKSKKNKKKRRRDKKLEEKQINSITKSLDNFCRISESE